MKEDNEINRLFDPTFNEKDPIKLAKRKSYFRITGISFSISILVFILFMLLKIQLTPYFMYNKTLAKELYYEIYGANIYTGVWTEDYQLVGSSAIAPKYKLLNGKPVHTGEISVNTPDIEITVGNSEFAQFSYTGNRVMNFFHPNLQYQKYANDLDELNKVNDGKLIEMALSFNQPYTYDEVVSMLPKEVTLQWNWVNVYSEEELKGLTEHEAYFKEQKVAGFPSISKAGEVIENPVESFLSTLEISLSKGGSYKEEFKHMYNVLKKDNPSPTNESVEIIGVVVVGDKQQLKSLIDKDYIKASNFGAIIDQY